MSNLLKKLGGGGNRRPSVSEVGMPYNFEHKQHVNASFEWGGGSESVSAAFTLQAKLGEGAFGSVYRAQHRATGSLIAIKVIPLSGAASVDQIESDIKCEIDLLRELNHESIVSYYGCALERKAADGLAELWVMMELCDLCSLRDLIETYERTFSEAQVAYIMRSTLLGLAYLHSKNVVHHDVKAANLLLSRNFQVKLADFGVSEKINTTIHGGDLIGTPLWMAPEVILRKTPPKQATKVDIWALGITAIEMYDGLPPHAEVSPSRAFMLIPRSPSPTVENPESISVNFAAFLSRTLSKTPENRPSAQQLLTDPFITGAGGVEVMKSILANEKKGNDNKRKSAVFDINNNNNNNNKKKIADTQNSKSGNNSDVGGSMDTMVVNDSNSNNNEVGGAMGTVVAMGGTMIDKDKKERYDTVVRMTPGLCMEEIRDQLTAETTNELKAQLNVARKRKIQKRNDNQKNIRENNVSEDSKKSNSTVRSKSAGDMGIGKMKRMGSDVINSHIKMDKGGGTTLSYTVFLLFLGIIFGVLIVLGAIFVATPAPQPKPSGYFGFW